MTDLEQSLIKICANRHTPETDAFRYYVQLDNIEKVLVHLRNPNPDHIISPEDLKKFPQSHVLGLSLLEVHLEDRRTGFNIGRTDYEKGYEDMIIHVLKEPSIDPLNLKNNPLFIKKDPLVEIRGNDGISTFLYSAEFFKWLVEHDEIDPSINDNQAIINASASDLQTVEFLLNDKRVDPSAQNNAALHKARRYGKRDIEDRLLKDARVRSQENKSRL
jgi:hypothetical protein